MADNMLKLKTNPNLVAIGLLQVDFAATFVISGNVLLTQDGWQHV